MKEFTLLSQSCQQKGGCRKYCLVFYMIFTSTRPKEGGYKLYFTVKISLMLNFIVEACMDFNCKKVTFCRRTHTRSYQNSSQEHVVLTIWMPQNQFQLRLCLIEVKDSIHSRLQIKMFRLQQKRSSRMFHVMHCSLYLHK